MKKIILSAAVVLLIFAAAAYAETLTFTEDAAVKSVVENSPALVSAARILGAAEAQSHSQWWLKNPMLELEYMEIDGSTFSLSGAMSKNISVSQEIPFPLKMIFRIGAANEAVTAEKYKYELKRRQAALKAYNLYASLYRTIKEMEIAKESAEALKQISRIAAARYGRTMGGSDMAKADLEYALLENRVDELEQEKGVKIEALKSLSGGAFAPGENDEFSQPEIPELTGSLEELTQAALDNSPELLIAAAELKMKENMKNGSYLEYIPDINIKYTKQLEPSSDNYALMFGMEIPLWFPATQQSMIGKAGDEYEAMAKEYEAMKNGSKAEAKEHFEAIKTHMRTMKLYSGMLIPQADAAYKTLASSYRSGKAGFIDVLDAERMMLELKMDYYMHMEEYVMHYRELMACCALAFVTQ